MQNIYQNRPDQDLDRGHDGDHNRRYQQNRQGLDNDQGNGSNYGGESYDEIDYDGDRGYRSNQGRREYSDRKYGSNRYGNGRDGQERARRYAAGVNRDYPESGQYRSRRAGGYGGSSYSGNANYGHDSRNYGDASNRGYGSGYYGGRQGWSGDHASGYDYDGQNDRGFIDKAGDEVRSWFGDDDAARRRLEDGHRGKGPQNYTRSDERIKEDANDRLTDDPFLDASEISVSVAGGEATLDGTVDSKGAKRRAEDCCDSVSGIKHVQNNLRVAMNSADRWDRKAQSTVDDESRKSVKKSSD